MRYSKGSGERLIVASGQDLSDPVILARTKPHSKDFRIWEGAKDSKGPVIATRCLLEDAEYDAGEDAMTVEESILEAARGTKKRTTNDSRVVQTALKRPRITTPSATGLAGQPFPDRKSPYAIPLPVLAPPDDVDR